MDMNDMIEAYIIGKQEGYFNVRLEYSILGENQQCRSLFMSGYKSGKLKRKNEAENDNDKSEFNQMRNDYITIMGYKASFEDYTVDSTLLKSNDMTAFDAGYQVGLLCKLGKITEIKGEEFETYMMIMGHEINEESFEVYSDILKSRSGKMFDRGHKVKKMCESIKNSAIDELNDRQIDISMNSINKKKKEKMNR